jgi:outer membrane protein assembly factor BamB
LVCLNAADGTERWRVDFVEACETPVPSFGFVCSPLVVGDHVFVQAGASLAKLDKRDGRIVWRSLTDSGGMMGSAFSSPILTELAGREQLLVQTREALTGVDAESGEVLWSRDVPAFRGMNILTPTVHNNGVFTSSYGGKSFFFAVSAATENKFDVRDAWSNKLQGYMSTPVVIDGHAYLHLRNQRFACIDLASGTERWISKPFGKYWSLVANGDRILALDERGELLLIQANPEKFQLVDRRQVSDDSTWAHVAVADGQVFVRALRSLSVYRWQ